MTRLSDGPRKIPQCSIPGNRMRRAKVTPAAKILPGVQHQGDERREEVSLSGTDLVSSAESARLRGIELCQRRCPKFSSSSSSSPYLLPGVEHWGGSHLPSACSLLWAE